ncbi:hypothetical protein GJA_735 [Janthinobacterium agaricidamnosum NBRC 102515 = DSM 9628]|uniref:Uncharacterized protein n=1 Tax=Janthinobacterium agaricidamnosum NBRC 102515 = DSM 9628 TaxID=1349767 RepID=W0UXW3_9BURK|nr:hypothetical protein GJA_735 [Janthinobacterium agaricidamnosum NBRC 102515 = DSM 9628]
MVKQRLPKGSRYLLRRPISRQAGGIVTLGAASSSSSDDENLAFVIDHMAVGKQADIIMIRARA